MAQEFAEAFYKSKEWNRCRESYLKSQSYLCERCLQNGKMTPAKIVHHVVHLNPNNITNPEITLNWSNLQAVCKQCHEEIHGYCGRQNQKRYKVDEFGNVICV